MRPEDITRLTAAASNVRLAEAALASADIDIRQPLEQRAHNLEDQYARENVTSAESHALGSALKQRVDQLTTTLWDQDHPTITSSGSFPHVKVKTITAPGFVDMRLMRHLSAPDYEVDGAKPADHIDLLDMRGDWGLHQNSDPESLPLDQAQTHALFEDDIDTLEGLYTALEVPIPPVPEAVSVA